VDAGPDCSYPPVNNDSRCPPSYSFSYEGKPCSPIGLGCSYPGVGDQMPNGCLYSAGLLCRDDAGAVEAGPDAGPGSWTAMQ
jgi:hypothetical protein